MNWEKLGSAIQAFQKSKFSSFMNWKNLRSRHSPRPTFQNPNFESMDELGKGFP